MPFSAGMGLFIYQTLDAIDGKQARRTGSSNALGELFDHGCDSMSTGKARRHILNFVDVLFSGKQQRLYMVRLGKVRFVEVK